MRGIPVDGDLIKRTRKTLGWTQERLATEAECDVKTIRKAEKSGHLDQSIIERLAQSLGIETSKLIEARKIEREAANIELVLAWQEAFNHRDPQAIAECFHQDGSVTVLTDTPIPGGGHFEGIDRVFEWAQTCFDHFVSEHMREDELELDAFGDLVFLRGRRQFEVTSVQSGQTAQASAMHEFRILDGKIISHRIVTNTMTFAKILKEVEEQDS